MHAKLIGSNIERKLFTNKRKRMHKSTIVAEYFSLFVIVRSRIANEDFLAIYIY